MLLEKGDLYMSFERWNKLVEQAKKDKAEREKEKQNKKKQGKGRI